MASFVLQTLWVCVEETEDGEEYVHANEYSRVLVDHPCAKRMGRGLYVLYKRVHRTTVGF